MIHNIATNGIGSAWVGSELHPLPRPRRAGGQDPPGGVHHHHRDLPPRLLQGAGREAPRILAAGRLVEKKGFPNLIDACRTLADAGLGDRVSLTREALEQEGIPGSMHGGEVFCLPSVWSSDSDVEGLPQLLMEAMACGLPVALTRIVGILDLVIDGETGLLVEPRDAGALDEAPTRPLEIRSGDDR